MKSTKPILLIFLMAVFFISCGSNEESGEIAIMTKAERDSIEKAEEVKESSFNYLESVDVSDAKYVWQKNLFWFFCRNLSR